MVPLLAVRVMFRFALMVGEVTLFTSWPPLRMMLLVGLAGTAPKEESSVNCNPVPFTVTGPVKLLLPVRVV